jgi:asparagine synthase (glutamine-hydrolysing)
MLSRVPRLQPARLLDRLGEAMTTRAPSRTGLRRLGTILRTLGQPVAQRYGQVMSIFTAAQKRDLYTGDLLTHLAGVDSLALLTDAYERSRAADVVGRLIDVDVNTYLPGDLLAKVDISTMANSLEARSPFLDHHLLEWAARLPTRLKVGRHSTKYLLKRAVAPWLPADIIDRPKMGFGVPLATWLRGELRDLAWDVLTDDTARARGLFRPEAVTGLLTRHADGRDESRRLWALIQFELWHRRFLDPADPAGTAPAADGGLLARQL